jgi:hypothetical protein
LRPRRGDRDKHDFQRLRHARDRHLGFPVGRYLQPPPMLFTRDGHNVFLGDMYRGHTAFLMCSGPSLLSHDLSLLNQRGILTLAVNNAALGGAGRQNACCVPKRSRGLPLTGCAGSTGSRDQSSRSR